ncbi:alpha/beta hydrolase [Pseudomonas sp. GM17]|uniref:alpha/beta hydrolase n=1 Tax=Pseudomonas sp. GM17 TaxID=1144323 RepID=UPI0002727CF1|nr:alpha/beta hydrolase [Pseudomonas sp. GM17]WIE48271.1 alpha/beta hydrolase [Pseudomonas sp. GM17]
MENHNDLLNLALSFRQSYRSLIPLAGSKDEVGKIDDVDIKAQSPDRLIPTKLYQPIDDKNEAVILFVHGGWWISGDLETHDVMIRYIANKLNAATLSVGYRLAPENPAPAGLNDVIASFHWLKENIGKGKKIILIGDSAGGNIVSSISHLLKKDEISACWMIYPVLDVNIDETSLTRALSNSFPDLKVLNMIKHSYISEAYDEKDPLVSPIYGEHSNLPPSLISVGDNDPLVDAGLKYADACEGTVIKVYKGQRHGFIQFFKDEEEHPLGYQAINEGIDFIKEAITSK